MKKKCLIIGIIFAFVYLYTISTGNIFRSVDAAECLKKKIGDADCKTNMAGKAVDLLDYAVWYSEFIKNCSNIDIAACGTDVDSNGDVMDANFNYPGTNYIVTDNKVDVFDYAVWIQGYISENITTPTVPQSTVLPTLPYSPTPPLTNPVSPTPLTSTPTITPTPTIIPGNQTQGIWISPGEIKLRPTSGPEWNAMYTIAQNATSTGADISNQDSNHDIDTLAMALVCVRQDNPAMCAKAKSAVVNAIDTENGGRWLAVGRNLGAYIIAADLLNLRSDSTPTSDGSKVNAWLTRFNTKTLQSNNNANLQHTFRQSAWNSASNASAQEGFAYATLSVYLKNQEGLTWSWNAFRRYAGDRTSSHTMTSNDTSWQFQPNDIVGIQDATATKDGCRLDGALANDMARGGSYSCQPGYTSYPWVGLEGAVPATLVLYRAGYPAFSLMNNAILRTHEFLWETRQRTGNADWFDGVRANEVIHIVNIAYHKNFLIQLPVAGGARTVDFTLWTHPTSP